MTRRPVREPRAARRACLVLLLASAACGTTPTPTEPETAVGEDTSAVIFIDTAREAGLQFEQFNGMAGAHYFPEINGSGAALFDYDNDGDLDAYLVQGALLDARQSLAETAFPPASPPRDRLYRNDLTRGADGRPTARFTDVTEQSGIVSIGYGMGVATGDYDNDGWVDLYVTNLRANQLFRNNGDGTFRDVTDPAGVGDPRWSIAAAFFDYDGDGWLDLYCGNYVDFNFGTHRSCRTPLGGDDYCGPLSYSPEPDSLFRNRGDGTFEDVTARSGIAGVPGNGMGVVTVDVNRDRQPDLYLANDGVANRLWVNQGDGTFDDQALLAGVAVNEDGRAEGSMGVDAADIDEDGDDDLFLTHLAGETNTVYLNRGEGLFDDASIETGLAAPSLRGTGFGAAWTDYDLDGWLDLFVANGAVQAIPARVNEGNRYPYGQPNQLFRNEGAGVFVEVSHLAGDSFGRHEVSRGAALGDVDNDGDPDILLVNNSGPARLLLNQVGQHAQWVGFRAVAQATGGDALGARVGLVAGRGRTIWRSVTTGGSYASAGDPRVVVGLGATRPETLVARVEWPGGGVEAFTAITAGRYNVLAEGAGEPVAR